MSVQPFNINVPQATLDDLQQRLSRTRWLRETKGEGWTYGISLEYMKELMDHWQHSYDWRKHETGKLVLLWWCEMWQG